MLAHLLSQWGHDFRPDYRELSILAERFPLIPRIALTATADGPTRSDIVECFKIEPEQVFISGFDRPNITYTIVDSDNPKRQLLTFINNSHKDDCGIVYCLSRKNTENIAEWLSKQGFTALPYHAE